jgi:hypothetical protein
LRQQGDTSQLFQVEYLLALCCRRAADEEGELKAFRAAIEDLEQLRRSLRTRNQGSCPVAWCSWRGVIATIAGLGRAGQAATAGNPTTGSSLSGAMVSSVM